MAGLSLAGLRKRFGDLRAVDDVTLRVADGGFLAVLGPSGCGKTTLLRLIAGFERLDDGEIRIGDRLVSSPSVHVLPEHRRIGIVFQNYALWPHLNVAGNVGYSLKIAGIAKAERLRRIDEALALVGLADQHDRDTASLSGGQRQRVALARCLVMEPELVLLDEPLANLDVHLRASMQAEFRQFQRRTGTTMVYITHDQAEAMALADQIAVMEAGRLLQHAAPRLLYREPASAEVARFIGEGMVLPVEAEATTAGRCEARLFGVPVRLRCAAGDVSTGSRQACFRADDFIVVEAGPSTLPVRIESVIYQGGFQRVEACIAADNASKVHLALSDLADLAIGEMLHLSIRDGWLLPQP